MNIVTDLLNATSVDRPHIIGRPVETDWEKIEPFTIPQTMWEISAENSVDSSQELPENALAGQEKFKKESTRCFILYGRGKYRLWHYT